MRKLWLVLVVSVLAVSAFGAEVAQARLDPSFGNNGVVAVQLPAAGPPGFESVSAMTAARDGSAYVLASRTNCPGAGGCVTTRRLYRYAADGVRDPAFGGSAGSYDLPQEQEENVVLAVDSQGRPLLAQANGGHLVVRRLTTSGTLDQDFGVGGAVAFECDCVYPNARLVPGPAGTLTVVLPGRGEGFGHHGTPITLFRRQADGSADPRFGRRGVSKLILPDAESFTTTATTHGGGLYLAGSGCCAPVHPISVVRISAEGRFDKRFAKAVRHSLGSLDSLHGNRIAVGAVLSRPGGTIELLGSTGDGKRGFQLRVNPDGALHKRFGRRGLRMLPEPVSSAALGSEGSTLALSSNGLTNKTFLARILADGRLDRSFDPESISGIAGRYGVSVVPVAGRRVLVLDRGIEPCRSYCPQRPQLIRLLEGPPRKRR
jgi:hypothetical protein